MSFSTAISGVNASTKDLNVISNNIANASTTGFKASKAQFAEVFASSLLGSGAAATGQGVALTEIRADFSQGNIEFTSNALDLAISGNGFFVIQSDDGGREFTRAGAFRVDRAGFLTNAQGNRLQGFQANIDGQITGELDDLFIDTTLIEPLASGEVSVIQNLDSRDEVLDTTLFDNGDPLTYSASTSTTVYDSLGNSHVLDLFYVKTAAGEYDVYTALDGTLTTPAGSPNGTLEFDSSGQLTAPVGGDVTIPTIALGNGATDLDLSLNLGQTTQFGTNFAVSSIVQDGYGAGQLIAFEFDETGVAFARFTNGQSRAIGQVALASFRNNNGLQPVGDTAFAETFSSGTPTIGSPGTGGRGAIQSSAVETANVDITKELVSLIIAQRNFSASAQVIQANDQLTQTIINLR